MNEYNVCGCCKSRAPLGNGEHPLCRTCYAESVRSAIDRMLLCEDCTKWCDECDHTYKQKRKVYFKHNKKACVCADCGESIRFHVLGVLMDGTLTYGKRYTATICRDCSIKRKHAFHAAYETWHTKVLPCVQYTGVAYRIQNADGVGPFRSTYEKSADLIGDEMSLSFMGVPEDDGLYDIPGMYAFTSMEALHYYITPKLLAYWQSVGYTLIEVRTGNKEVHIFDKDLQVLIPR